MQYQISTSVYPAGFFVFVPDIPSIIFEALKGFSGLSRFGASSFIYNTNCLRFNVCAHLVHNTAAIVEILGFYDPVYFVFDVYFYDENGACLSHHFCLDKSDLVEVFETL